MTCYGWPSAVVAAFIAACLYKAWHTIETIAHWLWVVMSWAAIAVIGTVAAVIGAAAVTLVLYAGHRIRRWQQARGACQRCPHPCTGELAAPGPVPLTIGSRREPS